MVNLNRPSLIACVFKIPELSSKSFPVDRTDVGDIYRTIPAVAPENSQNETLFTSSDVIDVSSCCGELNENQT